MFLHLGKQWQRYRTELQSSQEFAISATSWSSFKRHMGRKFWNNVNSNEIFKHRLWLFSWFKTMGLYYLAITSHNVIPVLLLWVGVKCWNQTKVCSSWKISLPLVGKIFIDLFSASKKIKSNETILINEIQEFSFYLHLHESKGFQILDL